MKWTPIRLKPCYKDYLWGGTKLRTDFGKTDAPQTVAESWELACHPDGNSVAAEGEYAGRTLNDLAAIDRRAFLGSECHAEDFPVLVKLIDAKKDLSIQVHPSDDTALKELGERGKAEMWYIVDCERRSSLYLGFSKRIDREEFIRRAEDGSICEVLNRVPVKPGDVFFILPGMIHAIGAGIVIAEIQQNSNTTFRAYDFKRVGPDGKPRALHLERAADVLSFEPVLPQECRGNSRAVFPEFSMSEMFACAYFKAYCFDIFSSAQLCCDGRSFQHVLCVQGEGWILADGQRYALGKGDSYFLPAALGEYTIEGPCRVLLSRI